MIMVLIGTFVGYMLGTYVIERYVMKKWKN